MSPVRAMLSEFKLQVGSPLPRMRMGKQARELVRKLTALATEFPGNVRRDSVILSGFL